MQNTCILVGYYRAKNGGDFPKSNVKPNVKCKTKCKTKTLFYIITTKIGNVFDYVVIKKMNIVEKYVCVNFLNYSISLVTLKGQLF